MIWKICLVILFLATLLAGQPYPGVCGDGPAFKYRWIGTDQWAAQHGCNVNIPKEYQKKGEDYYQIWGSYHTLSRLLPPEKYFEAHPDYFALHDGKRIPDQLCLSNPDVQRIVADNLISVIRQNHDLDIVTLGPQDNRLFCQCARCRALDEKDPDPDQVYSRRMFVFYKAVSDRVHRVFPDIIVRFGCYDIYAAPSKDQSLVLPPNTYPVICHFQKYCNNYPIPDPACKPNARFREIVAGWRKLAGKLFVYEYYYKANWLGLPWPIVRSIREDIAWYRENGVVGFYSQYTPDSAGSLLNYHVAAALMLDENANVDRLVKGFCKEMFGPGWKEMQTYYHILEQAMIDSGVCIPGRGFAFPHAVRVFTDEVMAECDSLVAKAKAKVAGTSYKENVQKFYELMDYTRRCVAFLRLAVEGLGNGCLGVEEDRRQRSEDRGQRTEDGGRKTEVKAGWALKEGKRLLEYLKENRDRFEEVIPWPEKVNPYMQVILDELKRQAADYKD